MEIFAKFCKRKLSRSTASIKIATVLIYLVLILHIVGFALPYWIKIVWVQADIGDDSFDIQRTEFVGLWQNCSSNTSAEIKDFECVRKPSFTGTFRVSQILLTAGIVGLFLSTIISTVIVCARQRDKILKLLNLLFTSCSGVGNVVAVILFERVTYDEFIFDSSSSEKRSSFTTSFILCTIAAGLCIFCVALFIIDIFNHGRPESRELQLLHIESTGQDQFFPRQSPVLPAQPMQDDMLP